MVVSTFFFCCLVSLNPLPSIFSPFDAAYVVALHVLFLFHSSAVTSGGELFMRIKCEHTHIQVDTLRVAAPLSEPSPQIV